MIDQYDQWVKTRFLWQNRSSGNKRRAPTDVQIEELSALSHIIRFGVRYACLGGVRIIYRFPGNAVMRKHDNRVEKRK